MNNRTKVNYLESSYKGVGAKVQGYAVVVVFLVLTAGVVYNIITNGIPIY